MLNPDNPFDSENFNEATNLNSPIEGYSRPDESAPAHDETIDVGLELFKTLQDK